jgi:hypothetical protein
MFSIDIDQMESPLFVCMKDALGLRSRRRMSGPRPVLFLAPAADHSPTTCFRDPLRQPADQTSNGRYRRPGNSHRPTIALAGNSNVQRWWQIEIAAPARRRARENTPKDLRAAKSHRANDGSASAGSSADSRRRHTEGGRDTETEVSRPYGAAIGSRMIGADHRAGAAR